jgi:acetyl-CoA acetyltransferase
MRPEVATGHNVARNAAREAGFGVEVPGITVNRYCGSGLSAASTVANRVAAGEATVAIAGGVESISLAKVNINRAGADLGVGEPQPVRRDATAALARGSTRARGSAVDLPTRSCRWSPSRPLEST